MLIQYHRINSTDSNRIPLLVIYSVEFVLSLFQLIVFAGVSINLLKFKFHFNIKLIYAYAIVAYWFDIVARIIIMSLEAGVLNIDDDVVLEHSKRSPWEFNDKMFILLFCCSIYRVYPMMSVCTITLALAIERYFATIWSSTYEVRKYKWISIFLVSTNFSVGMLSSICFHYEFVINLIAYCVVALSINLVSICCFVALFKLNKMKLEFCQTREVTSSYTLSLRFQLNENIKVMSWMKNLIFVVIFFNAVLGVFLILSNEESIGNNYPVFQMFIHAIFNLGIAIYGQVTIFVVLFSDKNFRKYFLRFGTIRILTKPFFGRIFPEDFKVQKTLSTSEETNVYFSMLSSQWDDQMIKMGQKAKKTKKLSF